MPLGTVLPATVVSSSKAAWNRCLPKDLSVGFSPPAQADELEPTDRRHFDGHLRSRLAPIRTVQEHAVSRSPVRNQVAPTSDVAMSHLGCRQVMPVRPEFDWPCIDSSAPLVSGVSAALACVSHRRAGSGRPASMAGSKFGGTTLGCVARRAVTSARARLRNQTGAASLGIR